jgi:predicted nucleic acid-binding protein
MNYVLDVSVALCWVIPRPLSPKARQLRDDHRHSKLRLLAPSIFPAEAASALTKSKRQKLILVGQARLFLDDILSDMPDLFAFEPLLRRATDISSATRAGLLDCLYVALAEQHGCEVITADDRLVRNLQVHFPLVIPLSSLP